jgi:anti-sigma regulatory factor (Ser/Thr protein kinase)
MTVSATRHDLFLYEDDDRLVDHMAPFLEEGLHEGAAVIAVLDARKLDVLRHALGARADQVTFMESDECYTRPEAALADYDATLRSLVSAGAPAVRLFGELPTVHGPEDEARWVTYDAILNRAFVRHPVWIMCGYDGRVVSESLLEGARRTHPHLHGEPGDNADFRDPGDVVRAQAPSAGVLPELWPLEDVDGPRAFRRTLRTAMTAAGVASGEVDDMLLAASEVLVNSLRHGAGTPEVRAGRVDGRFVCEIADRGPAFDDPLAGYVPPSAADERGAGLWVARQLTHRLDLLQTAAGPAVRLWI